ncbi:MAG: hypothetical protein H0T41_06000 [Rhodobacteraceae bacterium]|nr:hypothetical protein [Paracoccaceae bacterium]
MFGDAKTRGLNLEDTRLTDPRKLAMLMALVTFAQSWFRIGFDQIRNLLSTDHSDAPPQHRAGLKKPN